MFLSRRAPFILVTGIAVVALSACTGGAVSTPRASTPAVATAAASVPAASAPAASATAAPTIAPTAPTSASPTVLPSAPASAGTSQVPVGTVDPASTLDPAQSDAGVVGRVTIVNDSRANRNGTYDIVGRKDDGSFGSFCEFSFDGDDFTASANYDDAPNGQVGQMLISIPADEMPANDGETRSSIVDGRVSVYFKDENPIGTTYSADQNATTSPGTDTITATQVGESIIFDFTATTWDDIDFNGQMKCASTGE